MPTVTEQLGAILDDLDEWGSPKVKLPDCPHYGEDELGVIGDLLVVCYSCGWALGDQPAGRAQVR